MYNGDRPPDYQGTSAQSDTENQEPTGIEKRVESSATTARAIFWDMPHITPTSPGDWFIRVTATFHPDAHPDIKHPTRSHTSRNED